MDTIEKPNPNEDEERRKKIEEMLPEIEEGWKKYRGTHMQMTHREDGYYGDYEDYRPLAEFQFRLVSEERNLRLPERFEPIALQ